MQTSSIDNIITGIFINYEQMLKEEQFIVDILENCCTMLGDANISQQELAEHMCVTEKKVKSFFSGNFCSIRFATRMANVLGYEIEVNFVKR